MKKKHIVKSLILTVLLLGNLSTVYANDAEKKLYFESQRGEMVWDGEQSSSVEQFMKFTNMVPGESYEDEMKIENGSSKTYNLYFQVIPLKQNELQNTLLQKIEMSVYQDGRVIYQGDALGEEGSVNLQNVVPLGTYEPSKESELRVDLKLDKTVGLEFNGLLTKVDWKFMVQEKEGGSFTEIKPPKTGDESGIYQWVTLVTVSAAVLLSIIFLFRKRNKEQKR